VNENLKTRVVARWLRTSLLLGLMLVLGGSAALQAQQESRKLKAGDPPEYPELARRLHIQGTAKVMITVSADGRVEKVKELGGNPVLLDALIRAVKKWRYEPAENETVIQVKFDFVS
jgi:TonB family protein